MGVSPRTGWTDRAQTNRYRKLDDRGEAHLIALACSPAPEGHDHWNLRLLADRMVQLGVAESVIRDGAPASEKNSLKPWQKKQWCIPEVSPDFVAHMEDVLDLYAEHPERPVVCFGDLHRDGPTGRHGEPRPRRVDYEYRRGPRTCVPWRAGGMLVEAQLRRRCAWWTTAPRRPVVAW